MTPNEITRKVKRLQIFTKKRVNNAFSGEYRSTFKGRGMEFDEAREYQPGDDIRSIDWNITARQGTPYIKRYKEERQLSVIFAIDFSQSSNFGSIEHQKNEIMAELCSILAFSAVRNNDMAGLLIFTDKVELFIPPRKGSSHVLRLIRALLTFEPKSFGTNAVEPMNYLLRILKKRCVLFLVSDFANNSYYENRALKCLSYNHDVVAISVTDPIEKSLPNIGLVNLQDAETGENYIVDTSSPEVRHELQTKVEAHYDKLFHSFARVGIDIIKISTDHDYIKNIMHFFKLRERRISNG